jgi:hypothetical protein
MVSVVCIVRLIGIQKFGCHILKIVEGYDDVIDICVGAGICMVMG